MRQLTEHQELRNLVSIRRSEIDRNSIQGYILASSKELVVLQYVYDFHLDGLTVLRVADITEVRCTATDQFQKSLLAQEGLEQKVAFASTFNLRDWRSLISQLTKTYDLMILECETREEKDFFIGRVQKTTATAVQMRYFSGTAKWAKEPATLKIKDITACQVDTNYINVYERHFQR